MLHCSVPISYYFFTQPCGNKHFYVYFCKNVIESKALDLATSEVGAYTCTLNGHGLRLPNAIENEVMRLFKDKPNTSSQSYSALGPCLSNHAICSLLCCHNEN